MLSNLHHLINQLYIIYFLLCFVLDEIFENNGIEFTKINPDGSEWFSNDQLALRNLTRLVKSTEVYSKAIFLGQSSPFKSIRDIETIGKDEVYAEIDLKSIVFPTTMPSQVKTNYFACFFLFFCFRDSSLLPWIHWRIYQILIDLIISLFSL